MPNYKPFRELKRLAKVQLQGKYGTMIGALILQELLVLFATGILSMMIPGTDTLSNILYYILTFIVQLIAGILQAGVSFLYLKAACGMQCSVGDIFYCFKHSPDKAIKIEFVLVIINAVCMMVYVVITLAFTPVFYMMLDFPNYTVKDILKKSIEVMKGNKMRYFLLDLSFIPWMFVGILTCGIGLLWIIPYMNMTSTNFYLDLMACRNKQI